MNEENTKIVIDWLLENAYGAIGEDYWLLREFPIDKVPDRFHIPIRSNTKIWRLVRDRIRGIAHYACSEE